MKERHATTGIAVVPLCVGRALSPPGRAESPSYVSGRPSAVDLELRLRLHVAEAFEAEDLRHFLPRQNGLRGHVADGRRELESVPRSAAEEPDILRLGVAVDDEVAV